jgi:hypothetical protein
MSSIPFTFNFLLLRSGLIGIEGNAWSFSHTISKLVVHDRCGHLGNKDLKSFRREVGVPTTWGDLPCHSHIGQ